MKNVFGLFCIFASLAAFAFDKDRCGTLFPKSDGDHPPYYAPLYISTMVPSTSSYFSSIGPCSMYGSSSGSREVFIENSLTPLQIDAARGKGEYLNALAELSGCPAEQYGKFADLMHREYRSIFAVTDPSALAMKIDTAVRSDTRLHRACTQIN